MDLLASSVSCAAGLAGPVLSARGVHAWIRRCAVEQQHTGELKIGSHKLARWLALNYNRSWSSYALISADLRNLHWSGYGVPAMDRLK